MDSTKIVDILTGKKVNAYYHLYNKSQWFSTDEMQNLQLSKFKALIKHCYENVPYYANFMMKNDLHPDDVRDLNILQAFPILTKEIIKENYTQFNPTNQSSIKGTKTSQTGGTTGNILYKRNDAQTRSSVWGSYRRFYDWMGVSPEDKSMSYWGGHVVKHGVKDAWKKKISDLLKNSISYDAYDTRPDTFDSIVHTLKNRKVKLIRSYPQALYSLARKMSDRGFNFDIKAIMTTSEPIMPQHRLLFKEIFNAESYDQYGCGEIGGIAYECNAHNGLHVTDERVILEVNDKKELMITDLDNFTMPFIRYWNADQVIFADHECPCGRKSRLIEQVLGRTCDYLVGLNGQVLHWAYFWHLLFDTNIAIDRNFIKFQVVQKSKDVILIRTISDPLTLSDKSTLISHIQSKMGDMKVEFVLEEDIENTPSGKFRPVINETL